jgi:hypothetical protein
MAKQFHRTTGLLFLILFILNACYANPAVEISAQVPTAESMPIPSPLERGFKFYADNPVLSLGSSGSWDSGLLDPGAVLFHEDQFHMFYNAVPYFPARIAVGYAVSPNGIDWTRVDTQPVFSIEDVQWEAGLGNIRTNSVIMEDETWVLYFSASHSVSSVTGMVGRATASSPTGPWSADPAPVLEPGESGEWDAGAIGNVDVLHSDEGYIMYYASAGSIGMATSQDGKRWTKYNDPLTTETAFAKSDPVLKKTEAEDPNVAQTAWGCAMVYLDRNGLNYATSLDGIHWMDAPDNPILTLPEKQIWYSSFVIHNKLAFLFFEVGTGSGVTSKSSPYLATWEEEFLP